MGVRNKQMSIEEKLKEAGIKFEQVEEKQEINFQVSELKDANFEEFDDNQLRAAHLLSHKYMGQDEPEHFSAEEWKAIHERITAAMDKKQIPHGA
jgi:hypothetical protein